MKLGRARPARELGRAGEDAAAAEYRRSGYRVLARNWRCPAGEIDLVLTRADVVVFCEVKSRRGDSFGGPYDAVTWRKQLKLRSLAEAFLLRAGLEAATVRFDVASVTASSAGLQVHLFEQAF